MPELPGDIEVTKLFGFPGFEAFIRVTLKYVNILRTEQGMSVLSYEDFRTEIEAESTNITNETPG